MKKLSRREQLVQRWEQCLRVLQDLTPHQRRKHWNMTSFGFRTACGTVACAAGHCGLDPWFRRRGFKMDFYSDDDGFVYNTLSGNVGDNDRVVDIKAFFGNRGTNEIFYDSSRRSVAKVIKEVQVHIKWLHTARPGAWDFYSAAAEAETLGALPSPAETGDVPF